MRLFPCKVCSDALQADVVHTLPLCTPGKPAFGPTTQEYEDARTYFEKRDDGAAG